MWCVCLLVLVYVGTRRLIGLVCRMDLQGLREAALGDACSFQQGATGNSSGGQATRNSGQSPGGGMRVSDDDDWSFRDRHGCQLLQPMRSASPRVHRDACMRSASPRVHRDALRLRSASPRAHREVEVDASPRVHREVGMQQQRGQNASLRVHREAVRNASPRVHREVGMSASPRAHRDACEDTSSMTASTSMSRQRHDVLGIHVKDRRRRRHRLHPLLRRKRRVGESFNDGAGMRRRPHRLLPQAMRNSLITKVRVMQSGLRVKQSMAGWCPRGPRDATMCPWPLFVGWTNQYAMLDRGDDCFHSWLKYMRSGGSGRSCSCKGPGMVSRTVAGSRGHAGQKSNTKHVPGMVEQTILTHLSSFIALSTRCPCFLALVLLFSRAMSPCLVGSVRLSWQWPCALQCLHSLRPLRERPAVSLAAKLLAMPSSVALSRGGLIQCRTGSGHVSAMTSSTSSMSGASGCLQDDLECAVSMQVQRK